MVIATIIGGLHSKRYGNLVVMYYVPVTDVTEL